MIKITIEELKKDGTIVLEVTKRNATKMEKLIEQKAIQEITTFVTETGKD